MVYKPLDSSIDIQEQHLKSSKEKVLLLLSEAEVKDSEGNHIKITTPVA